MWYTMTNLHPQAAAAACPPTHRALLRTSHPPRPPLTSHPIGGAEQVLLLMGLVPMGLLMPILMLHPRAAAMTTTHQRAPQRPPLPPATPLKPLPPPVLTPAATTPALPVLLTAAIAPAKGPAIAPPTVAPPALAPAPAWPRSGCLSWMSYPLSSLPRWRASASSALQGCPSWQQHGLQHPTPRLPHLPHLQAL